MTVHVAGRVIPTDPRLAWRSVRAEAIGLPRSLWAWLGFLGVLVLIGAAGAVRSLFPGDKALGTTPTFEWGLLIVAYVFFAITTSGLCLASSLGTVFGIERFRPLEKRHAILAVLCLVTAFGIIALDLHYPIRMVLGAAFNPSPSSPMWWMGVVYGFYLCVLLTEVWSMFTDHPRIHQAACAIAAGTAIVAPTTLGAVFGVLAARPFWSGPFTPVLMVATAFLSGTALLGVVFYFVRRLALAGSERAASLAIPSIRLLLGIALVLVSVLVARNVIAGALGGSSGQAEATNALLFGPLAPEFWGLRVICGLVIPMLLVALPLTRTAGGVFAASCLALIGVFVDRFTFVSAGQIAPTTAVSGVVSSPYAVYTPSPVEVAIVVGAVGFVALAYTLAERYVDLRESDVHVRISLAAIRQSLGGIRALGLVVHRRELPVTALAGATVAQVAVPTDETLVEDAAMAVAPTSPDETQAVGPTTVEARPGEVEPASAEAIASEDAMLDALAPGPAGAVDELEPPADIAPPGDVQPAAGGPVVDAALPAMAEEAGQAPGSPAPVLPPCAARAAIGNER